MTNSESTWITRFLAAWAGMAGVTLLVMLTHQSDNPAVLGRYSLPVAALLAGLLLATLAGGAGALFLRQRPAARTRVLSTLQRWQNRRWFSPAILALAAGALAVIWYAFLGNHLPTYAFLRLFIAASIITWSLALMYGGREPPAAPRWSLVVLIGLGLLMIVLLSAVATYPSLRNTDEGFVFSMGVNRAINGYDGPLIYRYTHPQNYFWGGLWTVGLAGWLQLVGITLTAGRAYFLLIGTLTVLLTGLFSARLYGRATAGFAVLVGLLAVASQNYIRPDIVAALFLALALALYGYSHKNDAWWVHFLTGLAAASAIDGHPYAYALGLGFGLFYGLQYLQRLRADRQWAWPPFWSLALGGITGIVWYVVSRSGSASITEGSSIFTQLTSYSTTITTVITSGTFLETLAGIIITLFTRQSVLFALLVPGIYVAWREKSRSYQLLLILAGTWLFFAVFTFHYFPVFYLANILPVLIVLAARGAARGISALVGSVPGVNALSQAAVVLLVVWMLTAVVQGINRQTSLADVVETGRQIGQILPDDAVIVGSENYYFGMPDHLNYVGGSVEGMLVAWHAHTPETAWEYVAPDAIILSQNWPEPPQTEALLDYMATQGFIQLHCWELNSYGQVDLWVKDVPTGIEPETICQAVNIR